MSAATPTTRENIPDLVPFSPPDLYEELCRREVLAEAARFVEANPPEFFPAGGLNPGIGEGQLERHLPELERDLRAQTYRPGPVIRVCPVRRGTPRECVRVLLPRDRVVGLALFATLQPVLATGPARAGSPARGLASLQAAYRSGCYRVVPTGGKEVLSRDLLGGLLREVVHRVPDEAVRDLIKRLLRAPLAEELRLAG